MNADQGAGGARRRIIHLDLDAFFCAVEEQRDPSLRGKPFAVGGRPEQRGVVASCSYAARKFGVRSAMPMGRALRLCPELIVVSGHFQDYRAASRRVIAALREVTDLVEQISIDEAFLDISGLPEPGEKIARRLQNTIKDTLGLPCSLGVAGNKLVAKIASDVGKGRFQGDGPPNALTTVPEGGEANFLAPLPVRALWGIGPKTEARLAEMGVLTIGDLAAADPADLEQLFGKHGEDMARRARGIDDSPIRTEREAKSISQEVTFAQDVREGKVLYEVIEKQAHRVSASLQRNNLTATTVRIKIRWPDFTTLTRQMGTSRPTDDAVVITKTAWLLVRKVWQPGKPVRLIGVGVSGLGEHPRQLALWDSTQKSSP